MIPNRLDAITESDLLSLISNGVMEGKTIEYKRELPGGQERLPPMGSSGWNHRINFDGLITYSGGEPPFSYVQLYRNGTIEAVDGGTLAPWNDERKFIPSQAYEDYLVAGLSRYLATMHEIGCGLPVFIGLALTNIRGYGMGVDNRRRGEAITQDTLILPEAEVTDYGASAAAVLKPQFDMVWNACGYHASRNFDAAGNWKIR